MSTWPGGCLTGDVAPGPAHRMSGPRRLAGGPDPTVFLVAVVPVKHLDQARAAWRGRPGSARPVPGPAGSGPEGPAGQALDRILVISPDPRVEEACRARFLCQSRGLNPRLEEARQKAWVLSPPGGAGRPGLPQSGNDQEDIEGRTAGAQCPAGPTAWVRNQHVFLRPPDLLPFRFGSGACSITRKGGPGRDPGTLLEAETMTMWTPPEHLLETDLS